MNTNLRNRIEERKNINVPKPVQSNSTFNFEEIENELEQELNRTRKTQSYGGGVQNNRNSTSQLPRKNDSNNRTEVYQSTKTSSLPLNSTRTGMSDAAWHWVLKIGEIVSDVIKGVVVVGGILAANVADTVMGSIAVSLLVRPEIQQYSNYNWVNPMNFGIILSLGASSIQIYMWSLIQKRNISFRTLINPKNWKNIPKEMGWFLGFAGLLWAIDTFLDVSPMFVFYTSAVYGSTGLYPYLVAGVTVIVILLCGFAEILTSNMRGMFGLQTK